MSGYIVVLPCAFKCILVCFYINIIFFRIDDIYLIMDVNAFLGGDSIGELCSGWSFLLHFYPELIVLYWISLSMLSEVNLIAVHSENSPSVQYLPQRDFSLSSR